ncbi:Alpha/Beta hydrolase protein [Thelonectria olida]|uniref:1-alkyl-2-acetylglycerophosphocholine esterase n=1 Tax=Thelonectria olida TaxID=1576542 RepID=A0A9P8W226_9HYPO|nr:Alpha/Beta hydrolase protein [Thelonectria olida]
MHLLALPLLFGAAQALLVPPPPGPYAVAVKHIELVDPSRIDPFAPEANTKRRIMVSAYLPVDARYGCKAQVVPYMPPLTASVFGQVGESLGLPQGMIEKFEMEFCDVSTVNLHVSRRERKKEFPVAVFSPGYGGTRLVYGALARSVASLGYIVMTVDHTYEAMVVEFPDGSAAYAQPSAASNQSLTLRELEVRTGDESFLISQLSNTTVADTLVANFPGTFNPHKVAVYGHSFGGSTAAETALRDPRVIGGLNIDGPIYGSVGDQGIKGKPFVLVANGGEPVVDFDEFYKKIDAPKMDLVVRNTQHYAFTDVPLLLTAYQVPPASQPMVDQAFGTLNGKKVEKALDQVTAGLLKFLFNNRTKPLENLGRNPDIDVLHSDLRK